MKECVSIIIPAYNAEAGIIACLKSVQAQTYKDLDIIIVDDGSKDHTAQMCKKMAEVDKRISVYTKLNGGVSSARNYGLGMAKGKYIMFVDSDDLVKDTFCEKMVEKMERTESELVVCGYESQGNGDISYQFPLGAEEHKINTYQEKLRSIFVNGCFASPWNKLYRRSKIQYMFNEEKAQGEDLEFNIRYMMSTKSVECVNECLYIYKIESSVSLSKSTYMLEMSLGNDMKSIEKFMIDKKVDFPSVTNYYYKNLSHQVSKFIEGDLITDFKMFRRIFRTMENEGGYYEIAKNKKSFGIYFWLLRLTLRLKSALGCYTLIKFKIWLIHILRR